MLLNALESVHVSQSVTATSIESIVAFSWKNIQDYRLGAFLLSKYCYGIQFITVLTVDGTLNPRLNLDKAGCGSRSAGDQLLVKVHPINLASVRLHRDSATLIATEGASTTVQIAAKCHESTFNREKLPC